MGAADRRDGTHSSLDASGVCESLRNKTDAADAEAICEAVTRPTMRFVAVKGQQEQAAAIVLRTRDLLTRQRTQSINALRGHMAELGVIAAAGARSCSELIEIVRDDSDDRLPTMAREALTEIADQIERLNGKIVDLDRKIVAAVRQDEVARRLTAIPGVGPIIAATVRAAVPDPGGFRSGRDFAAWIGLTPRSSSSGGKEKLGSIFKDVKKSGRFRVRSALSLLSVLSTRCPSNWLSFAGRGHCRRCLYITVA